MKLPKFLTINKRKTNTKFRIASLTSLILLIILLPLIYLSLRAAPETAAWFNDAWHYRTPLTFGNTGSADAGKLVKFDIDTASLISAGKLQSSCEDSRFTDSTGQLLEYEIGDSSLDTATYVTYTGSTSTTNATSHTFSHTITTGDDRMLVVLVQTQDQQTGSDPYNMTGITWNGTPLTRRVYTNSYTTNRDGNTEIWTLANPETGTYDIVISTDNTTPDWVVAAMNFTNIAGIGDTNSQNNDTSSSTVATSITTTSNNAIVVGGGGGRGDGGAISISLGTEVYEGNTGTNDQAVRAHFWYYSQATAGSNTYTMTRTTYANSIAAIELIPTTSVTGDLCNNASTDYYVLLPNIAAGDNLIYHYYGNPSAPALTYNLTSYSEFSPNSGPSSGSEEIGQAPIAYWAFDEGTGTTTYDASSNANNGTISGATWQTEDQCISGKCLYFDGSNQYVGISTTALPTGNAERTISGWFKPLDNWEDADFSFVGYGTGTAGARIELSANIDEISIGIGGCRYGKNGLNLSSQWHHISVVFPESGTTCDDFLIYLDGQLQSSSVITGSGSVSVNTTLTFAYIGRAYAASSFYKGFIDEVRIYPYARTPAQIRADYASRGSQTGVSLQAGSDSSTNLSDSLIAYYPMDETTANTCTGGTNDTCDKSGNGLDGAWGGDATNDTGKYGSAVDLDGTGDYISIADNNTLDITSDWTISGWFNDKDTNLLHSMDYLMSKGNVFGQADVPYYMGIGSNQFRAGIVASWTDQYVATTISSYVSVNQWHHYTATFNNATNTIRLYVDGELRTESTTITNVPAANTTELAIGRRPSGDSYFTGAADEVRIYNRTLSPAEVQALYTYAPGPLAHYKLDENTGTSAYDTTGNGHTGTLNNSPIWTPGKFGTGLLFNGSNSYVGIPYNANMHGLNAVTVTAWINPYTLPGASTQAIIAREDWGAYKLFIDNTSIAFEVDTDDSGYNYANGGTLTANNWYHVAGVFQDGQQLKTYVNGYDDTGYADSAPTGATDNNSQGLSIGYNSAGTDSPFNGIIDDVHVYNYALNSKQIVNVMNGRAPGDVGIGSPIGHPIGYWKLDEGYSTTTYDSSQNGNNGTLNNMASPPTSTSGWTNDGKYAKALNFDGSNDFVKINNSSILKPDHVSVSVWFLTRDNTASQRIISQTEGGNYQLSLNENSSCTSSTFCFLMHTGGSYYGATYASSNVTEDVWHHAVGTYDGETVRLYLDGILVGTNTTPSGNITSATAPVCIGAEANSSDCSGGNFNGLIDELKIYDYALTQDEINLELNEGKSANFGVLGTQVLLSPTPTILPLDSAASAYCPPGDTDTCNPPIAEYLLDENTGTTANDTAGNGLTGTLTSSPVWVPGDKGGAVTFNGNNYITVADNSILQLTSAGTLTVRTKPDSLHPGDYAVMAGKGNWESFQNMYAIFFNSGNLDFRIGDTGSTGISVSAPSYLSVGEWYHLALSWDSSYLYGYVNGRLVNRVAHSRTPNTSGYTFNIASHANSTSYTYEGTVSEVRVYNEVKTSNQINWEYSKGAPDMWYRMDECQGTTLNNSGNNALDATLSIGGSGSNTDEGTCSGGSAGDAWYDGATGKINSSVEFDGTDDYAYVNASIYHNIRQSGYSMAAWVKPSSLSGDHNIIAKGNSADNTRSYQLFVTSSGVVSLRKYSNGLAATGETESFSTPTTSAGEWSHIAVAIHEDEQTIDWFLNGKYIETDTYSTSGFYDGTNQLRIADSQGDENDGFFAGQIDDVRIYQFPINSYQARDIYNQGAASFR